MKFCLGYYRYGFNGKEKDVDGEWGEHTTAYDYGARIYNPSIGRWLSRDPLATKFPNVSPYNFGGGNPILNVDYDGNENIIYILVSPNAKVDAAILVKRANSQLNDLGLGDNVRVVARTIHDFSMDYIDESDHVVIVGANARDASNALDVVYSNTEGFDQCESLTRRSIEDWVENNSSSNPETTRLRSVGLIAEDSALEFGSFTGTIKNNAAARKDGVGVLSVIILHSYGHGKQINIVHPDYEDTGFMNRDPRRDFKDSMDTWADYMKDEDVHEKPVSLIKQKTSINANQKPKYTGQKIRYEPKGHKDNYDENKKNKDN